MDEPVSRSPFVGRDGDLDRLDRVLAQLGQGGPAVVDVTGEAGIGKSRLVAEFGARAQARGLTVLRGRAAEYEQHSPFRPFADALADLDPQAERRFPALAELPPILRGASAPPTAPGAVDRFGLYRVTSAVLGRLGGVGLVMMLEDVHWADPASLELVDHLVRHPVPAPFLLVVSRRDQQSPAALAAALSRGAETGAVLRLALGPLADRDCVETLAGDLPASVAAELYEVSDGNPLYFLALLQAHRGARPLPVASPAAAARVFGEAEGSPVGLAALLLDELAPLSPMERRVVEAAAVLGDHAAPMTLGSLIGSDTEEVSEALRGLMARDLLRSGHGGRRLALRHPLIRTLVHEGIDPWRREELHRRAAAALAEAGASVVEQAHHVEHSMCSWEAQAADVLIAAAEQTAATAPATSAHWLEVVLRLLPAAPEHLAARRELTLRRARALAVSGGLKESRDLLHQLMDLPEPGGYDDVRTTAVAFLVRVERKLGHHREAEALLRRELARRPGPSPVQTVRLGLELCASAIAAARFSEVRADIVGVLANARSLGDEIGEISALALIALGEAYEGDMAAAREFAGSAAELVDALTDTDLAELSEYVCVLGWTEVFLESYADAEGHLDRGLEIVRRTGQVYLMPHFLTVKAHIHFETCRITTALELTEQAESIARSLGAGDLLAFILAFESRVLLQARPSDRPDALSVAEEAVAVCNSDTWWANLAACALAHAVFDSGDPHRALDILLRTGGDDLHRLQPTVRPGYLETLTNAALATGDAQQAAHWAERAHKEAEQLGLPTQRAAALRSLAQVAAHHGDPNRAATLFAAAGTQSALSGATFREAQSLLLASQHRAAAGDAADAAVLWHRGYGLSSDRGARLLVRLAERIRPAVFGTLPETTDELAALTNREREIADLVAEGLSSQAIATKLYLSPRTVETHLSKIYRKTGASSRAALASVVTRRNVQDGDPVGGLRRGADAKNGSTRAEAGQFAPLTGRAAADARLLVGREIEVESLIRALADLKSGTGRAIALVGEPGIGKSALLRAAVAHARGAGVPVFAARGRRTTLPALPAGSGDEDVREVAAHADDRIALMAAVDDLHLLADDRVADVERLIEASASLSVLCLLTYRQRQVSPLLAAVLSEASAAGVLEVWNLGPLAEEQARELLGDPPNLDAVYRGAEGNPQYLQVLSAGDGSVIDAGTAILGELAGLDPASLTVVQAAAVLGERFHPELLAAVAGLELPAAMAALDALTRLDLVRPSQPAPQLSLRHHAIGMVVYKQLEPGRRTELHHRAEAELAKRAAPIADRAHHIARAADPNRPEHARTLIASARGLLYASPADAAGHLQVALSLLQEGGEHWHEAQVLLARSRLLTGDASEGQALLGALRAEIPGEPANDATTLADSSRIERHLGRYTEAGALARAGLAALGDKDSATAAALNVELADHAYDVQDYQTSREHAETAAALARKHCDPVGEANALGKAALAYLFTGDQAKALETANRAVELVDAAADAMLVTNLEAMFQIGITEGTLGRLADSERHLNRGATLSRRTGQAHVHAQILTVLANAQLRAGNPHGALATLDEADRLVDRVENPATEAVLSTVWAEALLWRDELGDLRNAIAKADRGVAVADGSPTAWALSVRCFNAEFVLKAGDPARGRSLLLDAAGGDELPRLTAWRRPRWCDALAQAAVETGDHAAVEHWARLAEAAVEEIPSIGRVAFALRARMRAHAVRGDTDRALRSAREAIIDFSNSGERIELGRTLLMAAALAMDAGRTDDVGGWLDRAAMLADKCGSARLAADTAAERMRFAAKWKAALVPDALSSLSAQERRVADLASTGMTNSKIAEALVLSVRTVESHLAQVYRKLGISNRTSLTRVMLDGGGSPAAP